MGGTIVEISFIHLSDIHFHKTSGTSIDIDEDLRKAIVMDITINAAPILNNVKGVLVGGDIAFSGQKQEYDFAKNFLKEITDGLGIDEKNIYCVPGNHDVDQAFIRRSTSVMNAQKAIENANTIDEADRLLGNFITDPASPELLFKSITEYNNFAASYSCNINSEKSFWTEEFILDNNMKLKIRGMNSCIISSHMDHEGCDFREMVVGQRQIPSYENDVAWISICHHPVEFWKFIDIIKPKLDKRVDVQLYGHMHEQAIDASSERLVIKAGATQPTRGVDWKPRYNWISFECIRKNGDRVLKVKTYPRILSSDRDRFYCDCDNCTSGSQFFEYEINIDEKRRKNLQDAVVYEKTLDISNIDEQVIIKGQEKEVVYNFFELSYVKQTEVLNELGLLKNEYAGKQYVQVIDSILQDAHNNGCLLQMETLIKDKL